MILLTYFTKQWLYLRHHVHDVQLQAGIFGTMSMVCSCKQEWRTRYSGAGRHHRNPRWVLPPKRASSAPFSLMEPCNCGTGRPCTTQGKLIMWLFCSDDSGRLIAEYVEDYWATWIAYSVRSQKRIWHLVCKLLLLKASLVRNLGTCQLAYITPDHWLVGPPSP